LFLFTNNEEEWRIRRHTNFINEKNLKVGNEIALTNETAQASAAVHVSLCKREDSKLRGDPAE